MSQLANRAPRGLSACLLAAMACALVSSAALGADPVLVAAGDIACPPGRSTTPSTCQQVATSELVRAQGAAAVALLGDDQYDSGSPEEFAGSFDPSWGRFKSVIRPAPGNHEYLAGGPSGYFGYFGAAADPNGTHGPADGAYYSYDVGAWHVVSLDSDCADAGCTTGRTSPTWNSGATTTTQLRWLQGDLATHPRRCTIAYWHHPLFTSGEVAASPGVRALWDALHAAHADIVLNGHDHLYERFAAQDGAGSADPAGPREFVVGTGGEDLYSVTSHPSNLAFAHAGEFGVLNLALHPGTYDWSYRVLDPAAPAGRVLDAGSETCHAVPALTRLRLSPRAFRAGSKRATTIRYTLSAAATVKLTITAVRDARTVLLGSITHRSTARGNTIRFDGRLHGRALKPGRYVLTAVARTKSLAGGAVRASFRVTR